jgi:hypothetical protein
VIDQQDLVPLNESLEHATRGKAGPIKGHASKELGSSDVEEVCFVGNLLGLRERESSYSKENGGDREKTATRKGLEPGQRGAE